MSYQQTDNLEYLNLFAADFPIISENRIVKTGGNFPAGQVVAVETATGKIVAFDGAGAGGVEILYGVLTEAIDASAADVSGPVALTGCFNQDKLVFAGADTAAGTKSTARGLGLFWKKVQD